MQHFTELGLGVTKARISSDGGWFVDVFEVQEAAGGPVLSEAKLSSIKRVSFRHYEGITECIWCHLLASERVERDSHAQMMDINFGLEHELVTNGGALARCWASCDVPRLRALPRSPPWLPRRLLTHDLS